MNDGAKQFGAIEPATWWIVFVPWSDSWLARIIPGKYKHVRAFGYVPGLNVWVFYDFGQFRTTIAACSDADFDEVALAWTHGCTVVTMKIPEPRSRFHLRWGFWCVPAVKHLLGLRSGALRPDTLLRDCLRQGGKIIHDEKPADPTGRPEHRGGAPASEAGS